jgi:hypothetical protein
VQSKWLSPAQFLRFGRRLPFLASGILVLLGLYVRLTIVETWSRRRDGRERRLVLLTPSIACTDLLGARKLQRAVRYGLFEDTLDRFGGNVEPAAVRDHVAELPRLVEIRGSAQNFLNRLVEAVDTDVIPFQKLADSVIGGNAGCDTGLVVANGKGHRGHALYERLERRIESGVRNAECGMLEKLQLSRFVDDDDVGRDDTEIG